MYNNKYLALLSLVFLFCLFAATTLLCQFLVIKQSILIILAICFAALAFWLGYLELWCKALRIKYFDDQSLQIIKFSGRNSFSPLNVNSSKSRRLQSRFGVFNETQVTLSENNKIILSSFYLRNYKKYISSWNKVCG